MSTKGYGPVIPLSWNDLELSGIVNVKEKSGAYGFIPLYRTREEVVELYGDINILEIVDGESQETDAKVAPAENPGSRKACIKACKTS